MAQQDLIDIRRYITEDLQNPIAAKNTITRILQAMRQLEQFPYSGAPLQTHGMDTGYRSIVSGNYRAFYHCDAENVYVVRILYGRRDFMRILFGTAYLSDEDSF